MGNIIAWICCRSLLTDQFDGGGLGVGANASDKPTANVSINCSCFHSNIENIDDDDDNYE